MGPDWAPQRAIAFVPGFAETTRRGPRLKYRPPETIVLDRADCRVTHADTPYSVQLGRSVAWCGTFGNTLDDFLRCVAEMRFVADRQRWCWSQTGGYRSKPVPGGVLRPGNEQRFRCGSAELNSGADRVCAALRACLAYRRRSGSAASVAAGGCTARRGFGR